MENMRKKLFIYSSPSWVGRGPYDVIKENEISKAMKQTIVGEEIATIFGMNKDAIIKSIYIR